VTHIEKSEFTFGRSLNLGCAFANGDILVFLSGHCVPVGERWLTALLEPLLRRTCSYCYGRQIGYGPTKFSEHRVFLKYYPAHDLLPQQGFFANNANAAILKETWRKHQFDEELTGLEDMDLAKRLVADGHLIGYASRASVYHIHDETWAQVKNRYEREGIALVGIMPEAALSLLDFIKVTFRSVSKDSYAALRSGRFLKSAVSILVFRTLQYWGSYCGTRLARQIAAAKRKSYFYPDRHFEKPLETKDESSRTVADESPQ
jgi:GT2 family glycosyltransferase